MPVYPGAQITDSIRYGVSADHRHGLVRLGAGPSFSTYLLPALIKRFRRSHRGIELFVETRASGHLPDRLRSGTLDLVFDLAGAALDDPGLEQAALWRSQAAFIGARDMVPSPTRLRAVESVPFILFQKGSRMETTVQAYLDQLNFRPRVVMRSDSAESIKAMLCARLGISVLFVWNINADLRSKTLNVIKTEHPPLELRMALIRPKASFTPPAVAEFIEISKSMNWQNLHPEPR